MSAEVRAVCTFSETQATEEELVFSHFPTLNKAGLEDIVGEISSEMDRSSLCDIEKSSFKCFEIGLKMILPTQVHTQRITKTLLVHLPDL